MGVLGFDVGSLDKLACRGRC